MNIISNNNEKCDLALNALRNVIDPEIGLNIVDLGLVYQLDFDDEQQIVYCRMTLTTQFCPMGESITESAKSALQQCFLDCRIELNLSFEPVWNQSLISEEGKRFLNQ
ncbi:MAG: metal-sulfur cluster assembly factor [Chitinophagaceae bacterium]|nr:metal-sulfur cluster assembly factor [Chitinophagaceae bacterium]